MAIELGQYGVWQSVRTIDAELAQLAEQLGFGAIWVGGSPEEDLKAIEQIVAATQRIPVVTGIVNMWKADAAAVAGSFERINRRHPDRFVLGVGIGHPEATAQYRKPLDKIHEYLDQLVEAGVPTDRLVLAALGPRVLEVAAERTAGAHPYLTTPRHTNIARQVMGDAPLLAPEQKVVVDSDQERARAVGRDTVRRYLGLVNYRNNLLREGWEEHHLSGGGSDELIDELALHGEPDAIAAGIDSHLEEGADHVGIQVLGEKMSDGYRSLAVELFA